MVVEHRLLPRHRAFSEMGRRRANEARAAAARLGVPVEAQYFLGYPDRGILSLVMDHYFRDQPWRSRYTGASAVELADALAPGAVYDGADLERDVGAVLERVRPTLVLAPTPRDTHPDHRAVGVLAHRLMQARGESGRVRYWIVHGGRGWPTPRGYSPALPQTVAPRGRDMDWRAFALNAAALDAKRGAVDAHASQAEVMHAVMLSHVRATELYSAQPVAASAPACLQAGPC
jgi:LmbE family N-acetylglucosaminyl deacetylase